jgi:hypothetical protein
MGLVIGVLWVYLQSIQQLVRIWKVNWITYVNFGRKYVMF